MENNKNNMNLSIDDLSNLTIDDLKNVALSTIEDSEYINLSKNFSKQYLKLNNNNEKHILLDFRIITLKILIQVLSDLRTSTFQMKENKNDKRNIENLNLFTKIVDEGNKTIPFRYKISDFVSNREHKRLYEGLIYLQDYKKQRYSVTNQNGKVLDTYGGFLSQFFIDRDNSEFYVFVNTYWLKQIVDLTDSYSVVLIEYFNRLKDIKKFLFSIVIAEMNPSQDLTFNVSTLLENYDLKYNYASILIDRFIHPIKEQMDKPIENINNNQYSFNYSLSEDKKKITVTKYYLKPNENGKVIEVFSKQQYHYKMSYFKKRHEISEELMTYLKAKLEPIKDGSYYVPRQLYNSFLEAYDSFVSSCRASKVKPTEFKDREFLEKIKEFLSEEAKIFFN